MNNLYKIIGNPIEVYSSYSSNQSFQTGYLAFSNCKNSYYIVFFDQYSASPNAIIILESIYKVIQIDNEKLSYSLESLKEALIEDYYTDWTLNYNFYFGNKVSIVQNIQKNCVNCKNFSLLNFFCNIHKVNKEKNDQCDHFDHL